MKNRYSQLVINDPKLLDVITITSESKRATLFGFFFLFY